MLKKSYYILISLFIIILESFTIQENSDLKDFESKVNLFIKYLESTNELSSDRYLNSQYNDLVLENTTESSWHKTLTFKNKKTFKNIYNQTVKQRFYFGFHYFDTKEKCTQAFESLMNCIGNDCQSIKWGDESIGIKTTPFFYLKTEKEIIYCKIVCEHQNYVWDDIKKLIEARFRTNDYQIISSDCGGTPTFKN